MIDKPTIKVSWSRVLLQKLTISQKPNKFSALDITPNPLPCAQEIPTGLYIETDEPSPLSPILFL